MGEPVQFDDRRDAALNGRVSTARSAVRLAAAITPEVGDELGDFDAALVPAAAAALAIPRREAVGVDTDVALDAPGVFAQLAHASRLVRCLAAIDRLFRELKFAGVGRGRAARASGTCVPGASGGSALSALSGGPGGSARSALSSGPSCTSDAALSTLSTEAALSTRSAGTGATRASTGSAGSAGSSRGYDDFRTRGSPLKQFGEEPHLLRFDLNVFIRDELREASVEEVAWNQAPLIPLLTETEEASGPKIRRVERLEEQRLSVELKDPRAGRCQAAEYDAVPARRVDAVVGDRPRDRSVQLRLPRQKNVATDTEAEKIRPVRGVRAEKDALLAW